MPRGLHRPTCSIEGCGRPHYGHGMCNRHYQRWRSTGSTSHDIDRKAKLSVRELMVELLLEGIRELDDGCWICTTAYPGRRGYHRLQVRRGNVVHREMAHRVSYEHFKGPIPKRLLVCHSCDYPPCCNPAHLFHGTHAHNTQDMVRKQRGLVGELNTNALLTTAKVLAIYQDEDCGLTRVEIAAKYGVNPETISHVLSGRNWKHLFQRHRVSDPV
jgi:hypothetical protein